MMVWDQCGKWIDTPQCRTLVLGVNLVGCLQVGPELTDREVLEAFGKFGRLTGYRFLRNSNCAFIDFESVAAAADARQAMHGMRFDMWALRVEFKVCRQIVWVYRVESSFQQSCTVAFVENICC
jgi:hypothetical protein